MLFIRYKLTALWMASHSDDVRVMFLNVFYFLSVTKINVNWMMLFLLDSFTGFKSQSSHSYKPIASSRQTTNLNQRVAAKRNSTLSNKMSSNGMGTRSVSSGTLNQAVSFVNQSPNWWHYFTWFCFLSWMFLRIC